MPFLITALVGFLVLPFSATAPNETNVAYAATATTTAVVSPKLALADTRSASAPLTVKLTAYNALPEQTDVNPFVTASGAFSNPEVVAARSVDLASILPFGTVIAISRTASDTPGCNYTKIESQVGYRVIADSMNSRITNTVDILLDEDKTVLVEGKQRNPAMALGLCGQVTVRVVGHIKVKDIPMTQAELANMVTGQTAVLAIR